MNDKSPLHQFIAAALLNGSLTAAPAKAADREQQVAERTKQFEQQVAVSGLLGLLHSHPHLWRVVEQHVEQARQQQKPPQGEDQQLARNGFQRRPDSAFLSSQESD